MNNLLSQDFQVQDSNETMFVWAKLPEKFEKDSLSFSLKLFEISNVAISPGIGFGQYGEGYIRIALVENKQRTRQAMKNIAKGLDF